MAYTHVRAMIHALPCTVRIAMGVRSRGINRKNMTTRQNACKQLVNSSGVGFSILLTLLWHVQDRP
jgi:hypothetical protein